MQAWSTEKGGSLVRETWKCVAAVSAGPVELACTYIYIHHCLGGSTRPLDELTTLHRPIPAAPRPIRTSRPAHSRGAAVHHQAKPNQT